MGVNIKGIHGNHNTLTINNYQQSEIPFEKRDQRVTCVFTESERTELEERAARFGFQSLSVYLRHLIEVGKRYELFENLTLRDITNTTKNF